MNREEAYKTIEHNVRAAESIMKVCFPNFNNVPNAERFVISILKANEALRQIQRGNTETVHKYWSDEE
tara:strand:+ start:286 stop:489 length:204 start_codon:yes stop_codon:yes gene_type:complete